MNLLCGFCTHRLQYCAVFICKASLNSHTFHSASPVVAVAVIAAVKVLDLLAHLRQSSSINLPSSIRRPPAIDPLAIHLGPYLYHLSFNVGPHLFQLDSSQSSSTDHTQQCRPSPSSNVPLASVSRCPYVLSQRCSLPTNELVRRILVPASIVQHRRFQAAIHRRQLQCCTLQGPSY